VPVVKSVQKPPGSGPVAGLAAPSIDKPVIGRGLRKIERRFVDDHRRQEAARARIRAPTASLARASDWERDEAFVEEGFGTNWHCVGRPLWRDGMPRHGLDRDS
jgi:hypothetical protein